MRFIRGESLKEAIERFHRRSITKSPSPLVGEGRDVAGMAAASRDLELRKLLRRFTDVCNAIEYAHSRGVLHRDIKPSNIILGRHGETLVVDWGLAKATGKSDPAAVERTLLPSSASGSSETLPGSALGTPAYMSPEQAVGQLDRLGPRSDVYSLGATLYCLLTGRPPFAGEAGDVIHAVQRGEFPRPRGLDRRIDPALEAICLRAMASGPEDRYASCRALADDNPAIPQFQRQLADILLGIGWQLAQAGKTDEAIVYYAREEAIRQNLAEPSSATPLDRDSLANCQTNTADLLRRSGRLEEALAACERALAVREPLVEAHPEVPWFRAGLGDVYLRLGQVRFSMENLAGAATAWKRACAIYDGAKSVSGEHTFIRGCCHAGLAGLAGRPGSGVAAAEGVDQAEKAMAGLRLAESMGYRIPDAFRTESALDPLRNRADFRVLMMDLVMPAKAFAE